MARRIPEPVKQQVINLWMNHNCNQAEISHRLGISTATVGNIIRDYTTSGAHEPPPGIDLLLERMTVRPETPQKAPDSPADAPEQEAADYAEKPAEREGERGRRIPEGVRDAVQRQIGEICRKALRLTEELEELNQQRDALEAWLCEMEKEETA